MTESPPRLRRLRHRRTVGIRDVAELAGVSVATVSRTFNAPDTVSEHLRERVREVAARTGYVPNAAARELVLTRSFRVGAVIPTITNDIFSKFVSALGEGLSGAGYSLLLSTFDFDPLRERQAIESMVAAGVEGLLLSGLSHDPEALRMAEAHGVAVLMTSGLDPTGRWPSIGYDNEAAGRLIVEHMIGLGHRRIALMHGPIAGNDRMELRVAGMLSGLAAAGLEPAATLECDITLAAGRDGLGVILERAPDVTAVVTALDALGAGALFAAHARGIDVPGELSITGFDGSPMARGTAPTLSSLCTPVVEMGEIAAREIAALIEGAEPSHYPIELPVVLAKGGSCGPVRVEAPPRLSKSRC